ncbi:uncharacterized protein BCR38DRAFT_434377 [Pseudomassariella vexata]|uniref:Uncharacterized protein n=1 Tax=Pseudomassariella vexata TaxID=1141098 RepID=A0A1Y2DYB6_9PEZI|nr:uncharacterized protein BCR38DRAFT_434377 [Pseudomassariella vexata]ORY64237.1 hypothetical protein BCR38DRAFT_434377 [Pseudomassariella vexata]
MADSRGGRRYEDGEVTRYGAGESYRPFTDRTPRRARSPAGERARSPPPRERARSPPPRERVRSPLPRERARSPPPRERARTPVLDSDRYVPDRTVRRRSRSGDRFRRDRDADRGGDSWRRERSRSQRRGSPRRTSPRRVSPPRFPAASRGPSPPRRTSPRRPSPPRRASPPRRQSPPRRNSPGPHATQRYSPRLDPRDDRDGRDRMRSPRRRYDSRVRSRSPYNNRDRARDPRHAWNRDRRGSPRRASPPAQRASTFRPRSPSIDRRDDRFGASYRRQSPFRESAISSALPSGENSRRSSPHPTSGRREDRSIPQSPVPSRPLSRSSHGMSAREPLEPPTAPRSPPRGPAALRAPPTGPRDNRDTREARNFSGPPATAIEPPARPAPVVPSTSTPNRQDMANNGLPPSGPRGFVGFSRPGYGRGTRVQGRDWGSPIQSRNMAPVPGPSSATTASNIPTGPRLTPTSSSVPSTPVVQSKPFNPPKGPAAEQNSKRLTFAERVMAELPQIIPGGKLDPELESIDMGVLPELVPHTKSLKDEEEKIRQDLWAMQDKTRKMFNEWERGEREAKVATLRTSLAEAALAKSAGQGEGGSAF